MELGPLGVGYMGLGKSTIIALSLVLLGASMPPKSIEHRHRLVDRLAGLGRPSNELDSGAVHIWDLAIAVRVRVGEVYGREYSPVFFLRFVNSHCFHSAMTEL